MSAPLLWIILPALAAGVLYALRSLRRVTVIVGVVLSLILAWLAWKLPLGQAVIIRQFSFTVAESMPVLGRSFQLAGADRPILILIYLAAAAWFLGSWFAAPGNLFVPLGMGIAALSVALLAVNPFLYAALFIEMGVLLAIPLLVQPGRPASRGPTRFLAFQTFGAILILFSGWVTETIGTASGGEDATLRAAILLGLGFTFLLAIFPFHTWAPMLSAEAHPYAAAFVLLILPGIASVFGFRFFQHATWLQDLPAALSLLRAAGSIMAFTGGLWAAFQRHLGRMPGYAILVDTGLFLLLAGSGLVSSSPAAVESLLYELLATRGIILLVWALALTYIRRQAGTLDFASVQGLGFGFPLVSIALLLAHFSLAAFPLLAGFPVRERLLLQIAPVDLAACLWAILGLLGLLAGGLRSLATLFASGYEPNETYSLRGDIPISFLLGILVLIGLGLYRLAP